MERQERSSPPEVAPSVVLAGLRRIRFAEGLRCPRCGNPRVHRWGFSRSGRQRYRCLPKSGHPSLPGGPPPVEQEKSPSTASAGGMRACGRTFSDLTGTPAAYTKKLGLWPAYAEHLVKGSTIRASAAHLRVNPGTTFRWRHRLLGELVRRDRDRVRGWIELDALRFAESFKGQRGGLGRPARRRRLTGWGWLQSRRTTVAVAQERRSGDVVTAIVPGAERDRPTVKALRSVLERRIGEPPSPEIIVARGRLSPWARFVEEIGARFHDVRRGPGLLDLHVRGVGEYGRRLRQWLRRFHGVATRYLSNYLIWHRRWEQSFGCGLRESILRWEVTITGS